MSLPKKVETKAPALTPEEKQAMLKKQHNFYSVSCDKDGIMKPIRIKKVKIIDKLLERNCYRFDQSDDNFTFISINENLIKEVSLETITDEFFDYVKTLEPCTHEVWTSGKDDNLMINLVVNKAMIREALVEKISEYFSKRILARLKYDGDINIKTDEKERMYFYYANGYVEVTPDGYTLKDYSTLNELIWESQVLNRDFKVNKTKGMYEKFIERVAGYKDITNKEPITERLKNRIESIRTMQAYLLHQYFDYKLKCPIFTDEKMSENSEPNGRTGKTLVNKALRAMKNREKDSTNVTEINGKDFIDKGKHKYENCSMSTVLTQINDVPRNYDIELLFNDITEGITVDKKNQQPFRVETKIGLTTNKSIRINGISAKDRVVFFEFSDHFNNHHSPQDEFGCWFFKEWDADEWNRFDTYMIEGASLFLKKGLLEAEYINLNRREVIEHTSQEFVDFMTDFQESGQVGTVEIVTFKYDERINKQSLFTAFIQSYQDYNNVKFKQKTFTLWLRKYAQNSADLQPISKANNTEGRSNGQDWIILKKK